MVMFTRWGAALAGAGDPLRVSHCTGTRWDTGRHETDESALKGSKNDPHLLILLVDFAHRIVF